MIRSALLFALIAGPVLAADGITPTSLLIGQAAPLSGPAAGS